jgi:RNA polymerase sigma factor (sigma-70 family)
VQLCCRIGATSKGDGSTIITDMARNHPMSAVVSLVRAPADLDLADRCVAGDRGALRELFERERHRVHATLFRLIGSNTHIDDLVQDAFLEIFRSLHTFRGDASLRTWIDRCTVRVAYAHFARKRSRLTWLESAHSVEATTASAEDRAILREAARRLYTELGRLEPKQRMAFTLHAIEGRPLDEVARLMEASVVATKARVWRARQVIEARAKKDAVLAEFLGSEALEHKEVTQCDQE